MERSSAMFFSSWQSGLATAGALLTTFVLQNIARQLFFASKTEPPVVFHWIPWFGSAAAYGKDPYDFLFSCRAKYGDVFTFVLLGRKTTVYLGLEGNDFILNGRETHANAKDVYGPLTKPIFGEDIVYDCDNHKLMEQKKFLKAGLTTEALKSHVTLIENEVLNYIKTSRNFKGQSGIVNIPAPMAEITTFTASRALQGAEVRSKLTSELGDFYHDLDGGFTPINFVMPNFPFPHNIRRDRAQAGLRKIFEGIIADRRADPNPLKTDMLWNLMNSTYKDGTIIPDKEIANLMITSLMAGQHNSSNVSSWIILHLADEPAIAEQLYQEQLTQLSDSNGNIPPLCLEDMEKLPFHSSVVKETLRLHNSIHSIMRLVTKPLPIPDTNWVIPKGHALLASPGVSARSEKYFTNPTKWDPYRWTDIVIEEDTEEEMEDYGYGRVSRGTKSAYLPFGGGRHRCIGEKFAYLNLTVITATMVRNFKFGNLEGRKGVPAPDYSTMFIRPLQPADIRWERRKMA